MVAVSSYIKVQPKTDRVLLEALRTIIHSTVSCDECIKYGMPAFQYKGKIIACFRVYKNHIGFYPYSGSVLKALPQSLLGKYKMSLGAIQFPKDKPLPKSLIVRILTARKKEIHAEVKKL